MKQPIRKSIRLKDYDYSEHGVYFVTICTKDKHNLFWNVGAIMDRPPDNPRLSVFGRHAEACLKSIPQIYPSIELDKYVVMSNHIHMLIVIGAHDGGRPMDAPTISRIIQQYKGALTKKCGMQIWQKSFYEHIIRDENEYLKVWQYIDENPAKWQEDCYYSGISSET